VKTDKTLEGFLSCARVRLPHVSIGLSDTSYCARAYLGSKRLLEYRQ
jgi:hypothetical protein